MGKGFNNYMCKKFFHPASRDNLKRVWMAEQQTESYKKKQEELRIQYEKEQDLYTNKAMMSTESKEKLSVNFLYEPPPGTKKDREREDDEPEFKFEWQRKYNAPRESYCKGDQEIRDQPFGIQVRNVRCIKCHKWGHINTDKECPMYNQSGAGTESGSNLNPSELIRQMREDGLAMKKGAVGLLELPSCPSNVTNQQLIPSSSEDEDHMNESELKFLEGLSTKKKLKLLRKLEKMERKKKKKKKLRKEKKGKKKGKSSDSESSASESDSLSSNRRRKKAQNGANKDHKTSQNWREKDSPNGNEKSNLQKTVKKELENDLYTVLGRRMDFEGPPQASQKQQSVGSFNGHSSKGKGRFSRSRSNSKERSRSRTPSKDKRKHANKHKNDFDRTSQDNYKKSRYDESRDTLSDRDRREQGSKSNSTRGRKRSSSRDNSRRRSRSRSREQYRRPK